MSLFHSLMKPEYYNAAVKFTVNDKRCDNPAHYNSYIQQGSLSDHRTGMGATFVFYEEDGENIEIHGYVTIKASSLVKDYGEAKKMGFPALEIAELAVSSKHENSGVGTAMVGFAIEKADELRKEHLGIQYILLCADPKAVGFYRKLGFSMIQEQSGEIPREHWNQTCVPMYLKLNEL